MDTGNVLIIDDEPEVARSLLKSLQRRSPESNFHLVHNINDALESFVKIKPEVVILDLTIDTSIGPESGLNLLDKLVRLDSTSRILVLTSHSSSQYGVEALQRGALSYHQKPGQPELILSLIKDGINNSNLKRNFIKINSNHVSDDIAGLHSKSHSMQKALESLKFASSHTQPVLLYGETGTGKGVFARSIHKLTFSKSAPFVRYQPNFSNPDLVASELFGHKRGSFTGANEDRKGLIEEANTGTLFIDEIDAIPKEVQVLLLEVLQEKTFRRIGDNKILKSNFRLISALNKDPDKLVKNETLRLDFYHRIAHFRITIPPLQNRKEDIHDLAYEFLDKISEKEDLSVNRIEDRAIHKLKTYQWPGNVRELQATIEGASFRAEYRKSRVIDIEDLALNESGQSIGNLNNTNNSFRDKIQLYEEEIVKEAYLNNNNNQVQAAKSLQMDRTVFRRILERHKMRNN